MNIANNLPKSNILDFVVSAMKYIKLSSSLTAGIIGLTVLVTVSTIGTQLSLASIDLPSNNLPTSDFKDPRQDAYDGCLSRLTDKMQEDKAASTCHDYVYGAGEDDSGVQFDMASPESTSTVSPNTSSENDGTKSSDSDDDNGPENEEQETNDVEDAGPDDTESEEDDQSEPEDQIMVVENQKSS
jgi:hypothetical protein